jgi:hypothetical protein
LMLLLVVLRLSRRQPKPVLSEIQVLLRRRLPVKFFARVCPPPKTDIMTPHAVILVA